MTRELASHWWLVSGRIGSETRGAAYVPVCGTPWKRGRWLEALGWSARAGRRTELLLELNGMKDSGVARLRLPPVLKCCCCRCTAPAGKSSVGKSSLVNSLLGESVVRVQAFKLQVRGPGAVGVGLRLRGYECKYAGLKGSTFGWR